MATLFLGVGLQKFTLDTDTATTPREYLFYDGPNIFTTVAADLATEETECTVILAEESALLTHQFVHCLEGLSILQEYYSCMAPNIIEHSPRHHDE